MMLFHGGKPGLKPGDLIEPGHDRHIDGCEMCEARKAGTATIDPATKHADRVYVTSDREYASLYYRGDLYSIEPVGELVPSDEDHFPTWHVEAARVRGVCDRYVLLTPKQRRTLMRRWQRADLAALEARGLIRVPNHHFGGRP